MDDGVGFLGVARPIVEHVAIGRIVAQDVGAGEGAEEQRPPLQRVGNRDRRGRRSDIADEAEYLILVAELLHRFERARRLIAVVGRNQPKHPALDAAGVVDLVESSIDAELHLLAEFLGRAGEGRGDPEPDFASRDATHAGPDGTGAGEVAAAAEAGPITPDNAGPAAVLGAAIECSRSASWRSASRQSVFPDVTALRPSATLRLSSCVRSSRSASLDAVSLMTAANLSTMAWMRGRAMSVQASAEPTTGPTRPARSRTTSVLPAWTAGLRRAGGAREQGAEQGARPTRVDEPHQGRYRPLTRHFRIPPCLIVVAAIATFRPRRAFLAIAGIAAAAARTVRALQAGRSGTRRGSARIRRSRASIPRRSGPVAAARP